MSTHRFRSSAVAPLLALACLLAAPWAAGAASPAPVRSPSPQDAAFEAAVNEARRVTLIGPVRVGLADQGRLELPAGFEFIPQPQAGALLRTRASVDPQGLLGLIQSRDQSAWLVTVRFEPVGYIDGEGDLSASDDELLMRLRERATSAMAPRIAGWAQRPAYDPQSHRLVWSVQLRGPNGGEAVSGVSYNAALLGRDGVLSLHLVTGVASLSSDKRRLHELLAGLSFVPGRQHADFDLGRDRRSSATLESLVASERQADAGSTVAENAASDGLPVWVWPLWIGVLVAMAVLLRRLIQRPSPRPTSAGTGPADR